MTVKVYDGETCSKNPEQFWIGKEKELDITIPRTHPIATKIEQVFLDTQKLLQKRGANVEKIKCTVRSENVRIAFPTNSSTTELATLNQNKFLRVA
ncbi:MAG: hypothetical protein E7Y34_01870, partial [Mycoplasma sp.]|nr:hypothetical protein [Mycoplasma sp.]